jgi:hypothetical protein
MIALVSTSFIAPASARISAAHSCQCFGSLIDFEGHLGHASDYARLAAHATFRPRRRATCKANAQPIGVGPPRKAINPDRLKASRHRNRSAGTVVDARGRVGEPCRTGHANLPSPAPSSTSVLLTAATIRCTSLSVRA